MKPTKLFTAILFLLLIASYIACKKTDSDQNKPVQPTNRFFTVSPDAPKEIKVIAEALQKQNSKYHYLSSITKKAGYPIWDKARIISFDTRKVTGKESDDAGGEVVYIPFVRDSENYVNSLLAVEMDASDTLYRMLHDYNYRKFGYDTSDASKWSARDVFNLFASFDNAVFGHTKFIIEDGKLFNIDTASGFVVTLLSKYNKSAKVSLMEPIEVCVTYTVCPSCDAYVRAAKETVLPGQGCCSPFDVTFCTTYWAEVIGGGGGDIGGWTGTGDGTGDPSGGGGSGGTGWYGGSDPCAPTSVVRTSIMAPDGCGSGWTPAEVAADTNFNYAFPGDDPEFVSANPYETDCKSFQFTKTGNYWQEAGVRKIKFKVYYVDPYGSKTWLDCEVNQVVVGLPSRFSSGDAANLAAKAVDYARKETYAYTASYGGTLTAAQAVQYFRNKLNSIVAEKGGTASVNGSSSPSIVFKDAESTFWTDPYDC